MSDKLVVVKHNALTQASYTLSIYESRILLTCIGKIDSMSEITTSDRFEITGQDLVNLIGVSDKSAYRHLKLAVKRLMGRIVTIDLPDNQTLDTHWVSSALYENNNGTVGIKFTDEVIPFISQLSREFTKYDLANVLMFKSSYSIRFYELFKRWGGSAKTMDVEWMKDNFQLKGKYKQIGDLKLKVIDPAIKEINLHSDLNVSYEQVKRGRSVVAFDFKYRLKRGTKPKQANKPATSGNGDNRYSGYTRSEVEAYSSKHPSVVNEGYPEVARRMLEIEKRTEREIDAPEMTMDELTRQAKSRENIVKAKATLN